MRPVRQDKNKYKVTICVKNVPSNLTPQGMKNLFNDIGSCFVKFYKNLAFVIFANITIAELAIKHINENKIFNMSADFGKYNKVKPIKLNNTCSTAKDETTKNGGKLDDHQVKLFTTPIDIEKSISILNDMNTNSFSHMDIDKKMAQTIKPNRNFKKNSFGAVTNNETIYNVKSTEMNVIGHYDKDKQQYKFKSSETINDNEMIIGNCNLCNKIADKRCERCFDYYCSVQCQKQDWHKHRYVCFKLPKLIDFPKMAAQVEKKQSPKEIKIVTEVVNTTKEVVKTAQKDAISMVKDSENVGALCHYNNGIINKTVMEPPSIINEKVTSIDFLPLTDFPLKNSIVILTSFYSVSEMYIRSVEKPLNDEFCLLIQDIFEYAKNAKSLTKEPKVDDLVLARHNGNIYRGVIKMVLDNGYLVRFVDFGNHGILLLDDILQLSIELKLRKCYTFLVNLKGIDNETTFNDAAKEYVRNAIDNNIQYKLIYDIISNTEDRKVELLQLNTSVDFNKKLNQFLTAKVPNENDLPIYNKVEKMPLPTDDKDTKLLILDNSQICDNTISCIHIANIMKLVTLKYDLAEYCSKTDEIYLPRPNELCLAQINNVWYRGCCIESSGDQNPSIFLIDYGNVARINTQLIRKIPELFAKVLCMTHLCHIADLPGIMSDYVLEKVKKLFEINTQITIDAIECIDVISSDSDDQNEKSYFLHVPNIIKQLI